MCVIVFHGDMDEGKATDETVYGPFPNSQEAMRWASVKWGMTGRWYWLPLTQPD